MPRTTKKWSVIIDFAADDQQAGRLRTLLPRMLADAGFEAEATRTIESWLLQDYMRTPGPEPPQRVNGVLPRAEHVAAHRSDHLRLGASPHA